MAVISTQNISYRIVAVNNQTNEDVQLDVFQDEDLKVSNNVTGLFDIAQLPSDFTRQLTIPGTSKNNAFFEHVYDISIDNPFLFATNIKVPCYIDFNSVYLINGYLQLNKVNVYQNKSIDSYEITIFGTLSSFGRDLNNNFLSNLTTLSQFNHTASYDNITNSWDGYLFSGSIVYPLAEYGQKIKYNYGDGQYGIDDTYGALCVQDFKPAIRIKEVWDACFEEYGYSYSSSFWEQSWLNDVYMVCNSGLRYPIMNGPSNVNSGSSIDLETYGLFKISPISGSGVTAVTMSALQPLNWYNISENPGGNLDSNLNYSIDFKTKVRGELNLNFKITPNPLVTGSNAPQFYIVITSATSPGTVYSKTPLVNINNYMQQIAVYNGDVIKEQTFTLLDQWNLQDYTSFTGLPSGSYNFNLAYEEINTSIPNFSVVLEPDSNTNSFLSVTKCNQAGDFLIMSIPDNMPVGNNGLNNGIKLIDFVTSVQKKFNLVMYPNKNKPNQFIVETFNDWYKTGKIKLFDNFIDLNKDIEVIPANNLAVNKLTFGDKLDGDYVSQQFAKGANREYGKSYYIDKTNYFSQGEYKVETGFASSPLIYLQGTGLSGSVTGISPDAGPCSSYTAITTEFSSGYLNYYDCNGVYQTQYLSSNVQFNFCAKTGTPNGIMFIIYNGDCN
jgi:hypothetical protein